MIITVLYFAAVRDLVRASDERLELPAGIVTIAGLAEHLTARRPELAGRLGQVRFARNEEFCGPSEALADGDVIALIPPVAGG